MRLRTEFNGDARNKLAARSSGNKKRPRSMSGGRIYAMAEEVGFEPTVPCGTTVFKTAAFNHSAIPPGSLRRLRCWQACVSRETSHGAIAITERRTRIPYNVRHE